MIRFAALSLVAMSALAAPAAAQQEDDGTLDIDAVDALFGDRAIARDEDADDDAAEEDAAIADGDEDGPVGESDDAAADDEASEEAVEGEETAGDSEEETREPTDLERALAAYEICSVEAGVGLVEQGFAPEQAGREALLRCSGQRSAYVNAFYFSLLPRYPDAGEAEVRASAERLAAQTDGAIARLVAREIEERAAQGDLDGDVDEPLEDGAVQAESEDIAEPADEEESE